MAAELPTAREAHRPSVSRHPLLARHVPTPYPGGDRCANCGWEWPCPTRRQYPVNSADLDRWHAAVDDRGVLPAGGPV